VRLHNGNILIASGGDPFTNILAAAEIYNPDTGTWGAAGNSSVAHKVLIDAVTHLIDGPLY